MTGRYGSDGRLQVDVPSPTINIVSGNSGVLNLIAGTQTASSGTVSFADSNGITWGMSNSSVITASFSGGGGGGGTGPSIAAGTQTATSGTVVFSNSNNVTFGMSGSSRVTASAQVNISAGTTSNNLSAWTFSNLNGLAWGINASTITGSYTVPAVTNSSWSAADSATTLSIAQLSFGTANGFTFGLSTTTGGSATLTGSYTSPVQTNQSAIKGLGVSNTGNTAGNTGLSTGIDWVLAASQNITASESTTAGGPNTIWMSGLSFANSNSVTFGINAGTLTATVSYPAQTNQTLGFYAVGNTASTSMSTTLDARTISFDGAGGNSVGFSAGSIIISGVTTNGLISGFPLSVATGSTNVTGLTFSNNNAVNFGFDGTNITAVAQLSVSLGGAQRTGLARLVLDNSNSISFGWEGGASSTRGTASYAYGVSAGTTSSGTNGMTFSDANGVFWGYDGSNVTANAGYLSYWQNQPWIVATATQTAGNSTQILLPFQIPCAGSFSFLRLPNTVSTASTSQTLATNVSSTFTASVLSTYYAVVYSLGTGANSKSLQSVASGSGGFSQQVSISISSGATPKWTISQRYSYPQEGGSSSTSYSTSSSATNISINSDSGNSDFNGMRYFDIPFANSLSAGAYWLAFGRSSTTSTQAASAAYATGIAISHSHVCATQGNQVWGNLGQVSATISSLMLQVGLGSYTTNAMTTASIALSQISSTNSHLHPYFELQRFA